MRPAQKPGRFTHPTTPDRGRAGRPARPQVSRVVLHVDPPQAAGGGRYTTGHACRQRR
jgi:hypothetical protein